MEHGNGGRGRQLRPLSAGEQRGRAGLCHAASCKTHTARSTEDYALLKSEHESLSSRHPSLGGAGRSASQGVRAAVTASGDGPGASRENAAVGHFLIDW